MLVLLFVGVACGCSDRKPRAEPAYLNKKMSAWVDQSADLDLDTSFRGLIALAHFDISTGRPHTIAVLEAISKDRGKPDDYRGATVGLRRWLWPPERRSDIAEEELPLLFSTLERHPEQLSEWRPLCNFASLALENDSRHRGEILTKATELRRYMIDPYFMDSVIREQSKKDKK